MRFYEHESRESKALWVRGAFQVGLSACLSKMEIFGSKQKGPGAWGVMLWQYQNGFHFVSYLVYMEPSTSGITPIFPEIFLIL